LAWVRSDPPPGRYSPRPGYGFPSEQERALIDGAADQ
jgi:hypothetical protein